MSGIPSILAIDQGTTGSTALVFGKDGRVLGRAYSEFPQYFPRPGWVEHDAEEIWSVTQSVCSEALAKAGSAASVEGIGITNQRETIVLWDRQTLKPVHRAIVWQDRRTASICSEMRAEGREAEIRALLRTPLEEWPRHQPHAVVGELLDAIEGLQQQLREVHSRNDALVEEIRAFQAELTW